MRNGNSSSLLLIGKKLIFAQKTLARMMVFLLVWIPLCGSYAQTEGTIVEKGSSTPLPYCTVALKGVAVGTIANSEGVFRLAGTMEQDTLLISYVGYKTVEVAVRDLMVSPLVQMEKFQYELGQVEVFSDNEALYDLVHAASEQLGKDPEQRSRVFFDLSTQVDSAPVEVIESYYNGRFEGPALKELILKNGRIGVAPYDGRYFLSLNTTTAFALLDIRAKNPYFPVTPFALNRKQLFRSYDLQMEGMHSDGTNIYHIMFNPKPGLAGYFTGELWTDGSGKRVDRVTLQCKSCTPHPFRPVNSGPSIEKVDLVFSLFFQQDGGANRLEHTEMEYDLVYRLPDQQIRGLHTVAVLQPYDRKELFFEPIFDTPYERSDHHQITFLPYDSVFWSTNQGLVRTERQEAAIHFFTEHGTLIGHEERSLFDGSDVLFGDLFAVWNDKSRITRSSIVQEERTSPIHGNIPVEQATIARSTAADMKVTIYLDAYESSEGYKTRSATILDRYGSRYDLPMEPGTNAFLNIWFDLCEIERRHMEQDLRTEAITPGRIHAMHTKAMQNIKRTTLLFEKETALGKNPEAMKVWNQRVVQELGMDNLALFPMLN